MKHISMVNLIAMALVWGFWGCASNLEPAPEAQEVAGLEEAARSSVQGVVITAQADEWVGPVDIRQKVTPLRIAINNNSGEPLRVRYAEFKLVGGADRRAYAALPPVTIDKEVTERVNEPEFRYRDFDVAPDYAPYYPGMRPYAGNYLMAPYHTNYTGSWVDVDLPTPKMRRNVIPEGVVHSGGFLEGWLFFEKVDDDLQQVMFRADLVNAETGREFGEVRIPFLVE